MSRIKKWLMAAVMAVGLLPASSVYAAGSLGVSTGSLSLTTGGSASFTVSANNAAGRVDISSSNTGVARVSVGSSFLDNSSVTVTVTAAAAGSAVITIRATDMTTYDDENLTGTTRTVSVNVSAPAPAPQPAQPAQPAQNTTPASKPAASSTPATTKKTNDTPAVIEETKPEETVEEAVENDIEDDSMDEELVAEEPLGEFAATGESNVNVWMIVAIVEMVVIMIAGGSILGIYFRGRKHSQTYQNSQPTDSLEPQD